MLLGGLGQGLGRRSNKDRCNQAGNGQQDKRESAHLSAPWFQAGARPIGILFDGRTAE